MNATRRTQRSRGLPRRRARSAVSPGPRRKLGVSQSALSQTIRGLEARLGLRLLTRTTRSVAPTEAGERLLRAARPGVRRDRGRAGGPERAARKARRHDPHHRGRARGRHGPVARAGEAPAGLSRTSRWRSSSTTALTDIVAERYDAGVRLGEQVAKDMIAVRIGPDMRMAVVGAPSYFAKRPRPKTPQDLTAHDCINLRLPTHGGLYAWEFEKGGASCGCGSKGSSCSTAAPPMLTAALAGLRPGLSARGRVRHAARRRAAGPGAGRLVPAISRLPPLLPEPPPAHAGVLVLILDALRWRP